MVIHFPVLPVSSLGFNELVVLFPLHVFPHASLVPVSFDLHYLKHIVFIPFLRQHLALVFQIFAAVRDLKFFLLTLDSD